MLTYIKCKVYSHSTQFPSWEGTEACSSFLPSFTALPPFSLRTSPTLLLIPNSQSPAIPDSYFSHLNQLHTFQGSISRPTSYKMARDKIPLEILELIKGPVPEKKAEYYVERRIRQASRNLRRHIYQVNHDSTQTGCAGVKFLLQESPGTRGARCRLLPCGEMIEPGEYRVHVTCRNGEERESPCPLWPRY